MHSVFIAFLVGIACLDILRHKIYNVSLILLLILGTVAHLMHFHFSNLIFALLFSIALGLMRAGGGDIKFALIALPFFLPLGAISQYLTYFAIIAAAQLVVQGTYLYFFKRISFKSHYLALGPALTGALALALS